jgi:hypothetical protein
VRGWNKDGQADPSAHRVRHVVSWRLLAALTAVHVVQVAAGEAGTIWLPEGRVTDAGNRPVH